MKWFAALLLSVWSYGAVAQSQVDFDECASGNADKMIAACTRIIDLASSNKHRADALANRGVAWFNKNDFVGALKDYNEAMRADPKNETAPANAAMVLAAAPDAKVRDGARAVELARKAADLEKWKEPFTLSILAVAYAEVGNFTEAVRWQTKALESREYAKESGKEGQERLALFRKKQPYRLSPAKP